ncbi:MAG: RidA family protein [Acidobacteria bacterium]|nr:RidA family protein [Acidobacteriota bacterium]
MRTDRMRIAAVAGAVGLALGIATTLVAQNRQPSGAAASARRVIRPERAPNTGLPFSAGILVGNTLYIAGHLGRDPVGSELAKGGIEAETRQALANIGEVLKTAGMSFRDVTTVTAYITDFKEFDRFNAVYREFFPTDPPARATVQVAALNAGARVELQMIAVRP